MPLIQPASSAHQRLGRVPVVNRRLHQLLGGDGLGVVGGMAMLLDLSTIGATKADL